MHRAQCARWIQHHPHPDVSATDCDNFFKHLPASRESKQILRTACNALSQGQYICQGKRGVEVVKLRQMLVDMFEVPITYVIEHRGELL